MRKMMKSIAAVLAVSALMAGSAFAADKLIVKGTDGTTTVASITDAGQLLFPSALTGKTAGLSNGGGALLNFALLSVVGDASVPNSGASLQVVPRGAGFNANIKSQLSIFATDYIADSNNYQLMAWQAGSTSYNFNSSGAGTGTAMPINFRFMNYPKVIFDTTGNVGFNPSYDASRNVNVFPTHTIEVGNAAAGPGSGTVAIYPITQTTAPSAGGAAALPTTPAGYFTITINGVDRKVAYY